MKKITSIICILLAVVMLTVPVFAAATPVTGDVNGDGNVTSDDAIYLLYHVFFASSYKVNQNCDFDDSGKVDANDAIYLLYHVFFPTQYPLTEKDEDDKWTKNY